MLFVIMWITVLTHVAKRFVFLEGMQFSLNSFMKFDVCS